MTQTNAPILTIRNLHKEFDNPRCVILPDINLDVYPEDFICILGPSGCGKSTLIRCIAGFEDYEGTIESGGQIVNKPGTDRIMVFQDFNQIFPWKSVINNITYALKASGMRGKNARRAKAEKYLKKVNLYDYRDYFPHQLSGGMKQRVAIARSMALGSSIILMDEPFASLDAMTRSHMQDELLHIKEKESMTIIFITHNIQEAIFLGNRIMVMSEDGEVRDHLYNTLQRPVTPAVPGYGALWQHLNNLLTEERSGNT